MDFEALITAVLLLVVLTPLVVRRLRGRTVAAQMTTAAALVVATGALASVIALYRPAGAPRPDPDHRPLQRLDDGYVSSRSCGSCHPGAYSTWDASYHSKMTQVATPDTVLAPFDGTELQDGWRRWVVERRGDEFWVELDDLEWKGDGPPPRVWRQIVQTTGSHHFQFYWYTTERTRELAILHVAWALGDEPRWIPLDSCCISPPQAHYEAGFGRWSWNCIRCHATHGKPRIDAEHDMDTQVAELGIACESCHGPGGEHVTANEDPLRRYVLHGSEDGDDTIVNPARLSHRESSMICGNCHSANLHRNAELGADWNENGYRYRPGGDWSEWRSLIKTGEDRFWSDGAIRVSGREYNGLVETPCYQRGEMGCLTCHTMHRADGDPHALSAWANDQLAPGMDTDEACTQCHADYVEPESVQAHTHHEPESSGSRCYNCHMPYTTYGLLKGIRSHQLEVPDVTISLATGRPNPCNQCHLDQSLAWAADQLEGWYGIDRPTLTPDQTQLAASVLWAITGDAGQRALMAWSMGWNEARAVSGTDWMTPLLILLMNDPYHAVRHIAQRTYRKQENDVDLGDYDFTMPPEPRVKWMMSRLREWIRRANPDRTRSPKLLVDRRGEFDVRAVDRLLDMRDNRELTLNE